MVEFTKKNLLAKEVSLGEIFREKRAQQAFSLDRIAKKLKIKTEYLRALEKNELHRLPGGLYVKKFTQEYGAYLKIDPKDIAKKLEQDFTTINNRQSTDCFSHKKISGRQFLVFPKIIRNIMIGAVVIACLLYLSFYFKNLVSPPSLEITYPPQNFSTEEGSMIITGETEKEAQITINNQPVLSDENGHFEKVVNLKTGLNQIVFKVKKKYSRENIQSRQILVK